MSIAAALFVNPYRREVLSWYRKMLRAAFEVTWTSDGDALYVLEETRKLFRGNMGLRDPERIRTKLEEAEQRYGLAVHYKIPYPRMYHKTAGNQPDSLGAYATYLDSHYDYGGCTIHPAMSTDRRAATGTMTGDMSGGWCSRAGEATRATVRADDDDNEFK